MKQSNSVFLLIMGLTFLFTRVSAQTGEADADEQYSRANIAFSSFSVLGINASGYAKCVKSENYLEPDKPHRRVKINEEEFRDDGEGNDLAAKDGILTSVKVYTYNKGAVIIPPGHYKNVNPGLILIDDGFMHKESILQEKIKIGCKFNWVKCSSLPPGDRVYCLMVNFPFRGFFEIKECEFTIEW